jgi:hypothetical protein
LGDRARPQRSEKNLNWSAYHSLQVYELELKYLEGDTFHGTFVT